MGEKETMTGAEMREAGSGMATGREQSTPSVRELGAREASTGMATGRVAAADVDGDGRADAGMSHEDDWGNQSKAAGGGKDHGANEIAIGDPGVNGNITGAVPDGGGAPTPSDSTIVKSKSNITNNRGDQPEQ